MSCLDEDTAGENIMGNGFEFMDMNEADRLLVQAFVDANHMTN